MKLRVTRTSITMGKLTRVYPLGVCRTLLTSPDFYGWSAFVMLIAAASCLIATWGQAAAGFAIVMTACLLIAACMSGEA